MIRLLVVDDEWMVRAMLRTIMDAYDDIEVVGEAGDGDEAVRQARELHPDVVLMDIRMPVLDGIAATRRLVEAGVETKVVVLTTFDLDEYVFEALRAGASGFLLKDAPAEELAAAVRVVAAGESLLAPGVTRRVIDAFVRRAAPATAPREQPEHLALSWREGLHQGGGLATRRTAGGDERVDHATGDSGVEQRVAAGRGADGAHQLLPRHRLQQEPGGPGPEGLDHVLVGVERRQHDDGGRQVGVGADPAGGRDAVHPRHAQVDQRHVRAQVTA